MPTIVFNVDGLDDLVAHLGAVQRAAEQEARDSLEIALMTFQEAVQVRTPVNTGHLRGSISYQGHIYGEGVSLTGELVCGALYGYYVEEGRGPGRMPPITPIEYWAKRKGIVFEGMTLAQTAYLIARAIGRHGTEGAHMFRDGFEAGEPRVRRFLGGMPARILERAARGGGE